MTNGPPCGRATRDQLMALLYDDLCRLAARTMRRILVDHARRQRRARHGGDWRRVTLEGAGMVQPEANDLDEEIAIEAALTRLASIDPLEGAVVELRFFVGLSNKEIAEYLGVSARSVGRYWLGAKTWLRQELASQPDASEAA